MAEDRFESLRLVQVRDAQLVPRYLFDEAKDLPWKIEDFYNLHGLYAQSPFDRLFIVMDRDDDDEPRKGVVWTSVEPVTKALFVNFVGLHKSLQTTGFFKEKIIPALIEMKHKMKLGKIYWTTTRPKAFERIGKGRYVRSKLVLMELVEEDRNG